IPFIVAAPSDRSGLRAAEDFSNRIAENRGGGLDGGLAQRRAGRQYEARAVARRYWRDTAKSLQVRRTADQRRAPPQLRQRRFPEFACDAAESPPARERPRQRQRQ